MRITRLDRSFPCFFWCSDVYFQSSPLPPFWVESSSASCKSHVRGHLVCHFLPHLLLITETPLDFNVRLLAYLLKEIFVGACMGFIVAVPFMIAQNVGMIIDHQRGGASLMVNDPTIQNQSSPLGTLFNMVLIVLFFQINGPFYFIDAILMSYDVLPPDRFISPEFFTSTSPFWKLILQLMNKMMVISIQLAGPALVVILMTDFFLGIANRLAPQVQITFLGMPLKSLLGLMIVCFGWKLFNQQVIRETLSGSNTPNKLQVGSSGAVKHAHQCALA